jgi:hypothetical protein
MTHWWLGIVLALAGAHTADGITTRGMLNRGGYEAESAWIIGRHPSNPAIAGYLGGEFAANAGVLWFTERSKHKWVRITGRVVSIGFAAWRVRDAIHNTTVCPHTCRR